ncbi:MAG: hypothetical protein AMK71_11360 [Nitrospira bacterium SG8_35_4]|nr:MAG: hypothetical protein AMK71_11360 [Nitrospira bacterium SG8_35_4]
MHIKISQLITPCNGTFCKVINCYDESCIDFLENEDMKKTGVIVLLLFISLFVTGCLLQSLTPFYTEDSLIQLPSIYGSWRLTRDDSGEVSNADIPPWQFTGSRVTSFDGRGLEAKLQVKYFSIDDTVFMDITAGDPHTSSISEIWAMHVTPVHTLVKVSLEKDTLILTPLNYDWFESALASDIITLPAIKLETANMTVFNPASETWMAFLRKYNDEKEIFAEKLRYEFKRVKP